MTINTQAITSNYWIPIVSNYTGTQDQPDVVTLFIKWSRNPGEITIADEQIINEMGHSPANFVTALPRIEKAAKILFQELKNGTCFTENSQFWNAFKNFSRGIVQLLPLLGNAILYIHDFARIHFSTHPRLKEALSQEEGPVVGIAFDGKPLFTLPVSQLQSTYSSVTQTDEKSSIAPVQYLWISLKQRAIDSHSTMTTRELADRFRDLLTQRPSTT
jgi:hypothetical protein